MKKICMILSVGFLTLTAEEGDTIWTKSYSGIAPLRAVAVDREGKYLMVGGGYIMKFDPVIRDTEWCVSFDADFFGCMVDTTYILDHYIAVGCNPYATGVFVVSLTSLGDTNWTKVYSIQGEDIAWDCAIDKDGYYIITGYTFTDGRNIWVLKLDPLTGDTLWTRVYGKSGIYYDEGYACMVDEENNYIIVGYNEYNPPFDCDIVVLKLEPDSGDTIWTRTYGYHPYYERAFDCFVDDDGNYVVIGTTDAFSTWADGWVLKLNPKDGDTIWTKRNGGDKWDKFHAGMVNTEGNYILVGKSNSFTPSDSWDLWITKMDKNGNILWNKTYGIRPIYETAWGCALDKDGNYIVVGEKGDDAWILKVQGPQQCIPTEYNRECFSKFIIENYDITGRKIKNLKKQKIGIYFFKSQNKTIKKLIKLF